MKKAIKEFIIEEHANACSEWKQKIEERYPELFKPEIEVGKWYTRDLFPKTKIFITESEGEKFKGYGINGNGEWANDYNGHLCFSSLTLLTDEQIQTALIAEAKRRGFKEGVNAEWVDGHSMGDTIDEYDLNHITFGLSYPNTLEFGNKAVFKDGVWATIIEEEKPEQNTYTVDKNVLQGISFTIKNKNEEPQTITILGSENPLIINVPANTTITINT